MIYVGLLSRLDQIPRALVCLDSRPRPQRLTWDGKLYDFVD